MLINIDVDLEININFIYLNNAIFILQKYNYY